MGRIISKIKKISRELAKKIIYRAENSSGFFFTYHRRPIAAANVSMREEAPAAIPRCAIVIQGPLVHDKNFTLETVKIYRDNFPKALIIVSTWNDENYDYAAEIKAGGADEVLLNEKPSYGGLGNINYQLVSSAAGMNKAKELGAEYAAKTRADQRIYSPNFLEFFYNLARVFPVAPTYKQKDRVITMSLDTFKNRIYQISDMLVFGHIDDLLIYWGLPLETKEYAAAKKTEENKAAAGQREKISEGEFPVSEQELTANFLKKVGRNLVWTYEDSRRALAEHFCVADQDAIDIYWYKYARLTERRHYYYNRDNFWDKHEVSFADWLNLYSALKK